MGQSQDATDSTRSHDSGARVIRRVAPGVYFASDGMLTADSLDSAITYLRELAEPAAEGN